MRQTANFLAAAALLLAVTTNATIFQNYPATCGYLVNQCEETRGYCEGNATSCTDLWYCTRSFTQCINSLPSGAGQFGACATWYGTMVNESIAAVNTILPNPNYFNVTTLFQDCMQAVQNRVTLSGLQLNTNNTSCPTNVTFTCPITNLVREWTVTIQDAANNLNPSLGGGGDPVSIGEASREGFGNLLGISPNLIHIRETYYASSPMGWYTKFVINDGGVPNAPGLQTIKDTFNAVQTDTPALMAAFSKMINVTNNMSVPGSIYSYSNVESYFVQMVGTPAPTPVPPTNPPTTNPPSPTNATTVPPPPANTSNATQPPAPTNGTQPPVTQAPPVSGCQYNVIASTSAVLAGENNADPLYVWAFNLCEPLAPAGLPPCPGGPGYVNQYNNTHCLNSWAVKRRTEFSGTWIEFSNNQGIILDVFLECSTDPAAQPNGIDAGGARARYIVPSGGSNVLHKIAINLKTPQLGQCQSSNNTNGTNGSAPVTTVAVPTTTAPVPAPTTAVPPPPPTSAPTVCTSTATSGVNDLYTIPSVCDEESGPATECIVAYQWCRGNATNCKQMLRCARRRVKCFNNILEPSNTSACLPWWNALHAARQNVTTVESYLVSPLYSSCVASTCAAAGEKQQLLTNGAACPVTEPTKWCKRPKAPVKFTVSFAGEFSLEVLVNPRKRQRVRRLAARGLARVLRVAEHLIQILELRLGSLMVDFSLTSDEDDAEEQAEAPVSPAQVQTNLGVAASSSSVTASSFAELGTETGVAPVVTQVTVANLPDGQTPAPVPPLPTAAPTPQPTESPNLLEESSSSMVAVWVAAVLVMAAALL